MATTLRNKPLLAEIETYWTGRAETYSLSIGDEFAQKRDEVWLQAIRSHVSAPAGRTAKVLDIGTGPGFFAILLARAGFQVTAVDCTEAMLDKARENAGDVADKIEFLRMDAQTLDFADGTFDVVVNRNLTWLLREPDAAYAEWHRVLKKGGRMLVFDSNWYGYLYDEGLAADHKQDEAAKARLRGQGAPTDYCTGAQVSACEQIALKLPLSRMARPHWDVLALLRAGFVSLGVETEAWKTLWTDEEKELYASSPMFMITAQK